jgi:hypothetical protein
LKAPEQIRELLACSVLFYGKGKPSPCPSLKGGEKISGAVAPFAPAFFTQIRQRFFVKRVNAEHAELPNKYGSFWLV